MSDGPSLIEQDRQHVKLLEKILVAAFNKKWEKAKSAWNNRSSTTGYNLSPLPEWIGEAIRQKDRDKLLAPLEETELEHIEHLAGTYYREIYAILIPPKFTMDWAVVLLECGHIIKIPGPYALSGYLMECYVCEGVSP